MILEMEPVSVSPALAMIREAARGHIPWAQATEDIAQRLHVQGLALARMAPVNANLTALDGFKLFVSRSFLERWRAAHGTASAVVDDLYEEPRRLYEFVIFEPLGGGEDHLRQTLGSENHTGLAIDCAEGFYALLIDGPPPPNETPQAAHGLVLCVQALSRIAQTNELVRQAQQDVVLRLLDSGGTAAFVLNRDGWVKNRNDSAQKLLGELLHVPAVSGAVLAAQKVSSRDLAGTLPLAEARSRQISILTPTGRRLMAYAVALKPDHSMCGAEDELLIAWDMRPYAAMVDRLGEKTTEPVARALRETFGLTRMESILATTLIGRDLRSAAAECGIAYETARSHLKRMYPRMGIATQSELTALLSRFAYHERLRTTLAAV